MKWIFYFIIGWFFLSCSKPHTISCVKVVNEYKKPDFLHHIYAEENFHSVGIALKEESLRKNFENKLNWFIDDVQNQRFQKIENPFIDEYCYQASIVLNENNKTKRNKKSIDILKNWQKSYDEKINNIKFKKHILKGRTCFKIAKKLNKIIIERVKGNKTYEAGNYEILKKQYVDCIDLVKLNQKDNK